MHFYIIIIYSFLECQGLINTNYKRTDFILKTKPKYVITFTEICKKKSTSIKMRKNIIYYFSGKFNFDTK